MVRVRFPARRIDGSIGEQTGLVELPTSPPPPAGYPFVVYGHMTTGGSARSAPSIGDPTHPEWRRMSQGDVLCGLLRRRGFAVLRPDYEGLGSPGPHPYLIGSSLAESMLAMVRSREQFGVPLSRRWLAAGHSEGAVAALHAAQRHGHEGGDTELVGVAAFAPVTRMELTIGAMRRVRVRVPGSGIVSALTALMLQGAATEDPRLADLLHGDGLSPAARRLWPTLGQLSLTELAERSSWGALPPGSIGGESSDEVFALLAQSFRRNDVAGLTDLSVPVRIDAGLVDEVAPAPLTRRLIRGYRAAGMDVTARWWPTHHSGVVREAYAPREAAEWIAARF
ncbi:lipase family protein [Microbacterium sp.]|uniref:lipase family protein n=1 Tax=Microbacterium sp. TaxID=51671 RepID=UPI0039E3AA4A